MQQSPLANPMKGGKVKRRGVECASTRSVHENYTYGPFVRSAATEGGPVLGTPPTTKRNIIA